MRVRDGVCGFFTFSRLLAHPGVALDGVMSRVGMHVMAVGARRKSMCKVKGSSQQRQVRGCVDILKLCSIGIQLELRSRLT